MKKIILSIAIVVAYCFNVNAQDTTKTWHVGGLISINYSQVSFTNWAAGGQNSTAGNGLISLFAHYKKNKSTWDNTLDVAYGMLQQGSAKLLKSDDRIELNSKYGHYAFKHWYYSALLNFQTQMAPGFNYPNDSTVISKFLAPGYVVTSIGMDYKPCDYFSLFLGPLTGRVVIVNDQTLANEGSYGVQAAVYDPLTGALITPGKQTEDEFGGFVRAVFKKDIFKNINLQSTLELFSNYLKNPQNVVVNWTNLLSFKVNKLISATVTTQMIYDNNIDIPQYNSAGLETSAGPRLQFKEVLGIGLSYKFKN
ncbi:MAG TPA: DUF3078 domain-containing protein [Bacteroidia bacterium]|nr:DUF3078 domain-containing protein [Bacteroidia bacterium]